MTASAPSERALQGALRLPALGVIRAGGADAAAFLHHLIGRMNYVDCMIYLWNEDKTKMVQKAAYGPKGKPEYISSQIFDVLPGQGVVGHVINTMQPVLIRDTRKDNRYRCPE